MRVLLDECLPVDFRHHLPGHEVHTAEWAGFKGLKNGQLLREAESAGWSRTNQIEDLVLVVEGILRGLAEIRVGQVAYVG